LKPKIKMPRIFYPKAIALNYKVHLRGLMKSWILRIFETLERKIPPAIADADQEHRTDAWPEAVTEIMGQLRLSFESDIRANETYALNIGQRTSKWNNTQWRNTMKSVLGVEDIFRRDKFLASRLKSFVNMNTELITKLSNETLANVHRIVESGIKSGDRYESIKDNLLEEGFTDSERRAEFIARDQVSKLNGELTEARQKALGLEYYTWRANTDGRTRGDPNGKYPDANPSHWVLNGMLCKWDDDSVYSDDNGETWKDRSEIDGFIGHPGEDFDCRCYAEAVLDDLIEEE